MDENYTEYAVQAGKTAKNSLRDRIAGVLFGGGLVEYETIYMDGTLEISVIYGKSSRKRRFLCDMKQVQGYRLGTRDEISGALENRQGLLLRRAGSSLLRFEDGYRKRIFDRMF